VRSRRACLEAGSRDDVVEADYDCLFRAILDAEDCSKPFQSTSRFGAEDLGWAEAVRATGDCLATAVDGKPVPNSTFFRL
jgi:hypothetical protein